MVLWTAFILGLMGSWHCVAMCGPIALMVPKGRSGSRTIPMLLYHGGKIIAYAIIGLLMGSMALFFTSFDFQSVLLIIAGVLMVIIAFFPIVFNFIERKGYTLFRPMVRLKTALAKSLKKDTVDFAFYIGFLNGFIPCGMVYFAGIGALAQDSFLDSVLYMVFFGLGTFPFMSILILVSSYFKNKFIVHAGKLRTAGLFLIGIFMIWQGLNHYNIRLNATEIQSRDFHVCY